MFLAMRVLLASLVVSLARAKDVLMFGARFGPTGTASSFATGMCEPAMLATLPTFESESQQREAVCKKYGKENFAFKEIKEAKETVCACVTCVEPQAPVCPPTGDWEPDKGKPDRCFKVVPLKKGNKKVDNPVCPTGWQAYEEGGKFFCVVLNPSLKGVGADMVCPDGTKAVNDECLTDACPSEVPKPEVMDQEQTGFVTEGIAPWSFEKLEGECKCKSPKVEKCKSPKIKVPGSDPLTCLSGAFVPCGNPGSGNEHFTLNAVEGFMAHSYENAKLPANVGTHKGKTSGTEAVKEYFNKVIAEGGKHLCKVEVLANPTKVEGQKTANTIHWTGKELFVSYELDSPATKETQFTDLVCGDDGDAMAMIDGKKQCVPPCAPPSSYSDADGKPSLIPTKCCGAPIKPCPITIPLDAIACGPTSGTYVEAMFNEMARLRPKNTEAKDSIEMLATSASMWALTMEQAQDCLVTTTCKGKGFHKRRSECDALQWPNAFVKNNPCTIGFADGCSTNFAKVKKFIWSAKSFDQEVGGKIVNNLQAANRAGFTVNPQDLTGLATGTAPKLDCRKSYCAKLVAHFSDGKAPFCDNTENPDLCKEIVLKAKGSASDKQSTWGKISSSLFQPPSCK